MNGIDIVGAAALILGQAEIKLACIRVDGDALGPVHQRGAEEIGGAARLDGDIGLRLKAVLRRQWAIAEDERQPCHAAIRIEAGDGERAMVEELAVRYAQRWVESAR